MSTYITLNHIQIQNANCVNGLTFGFPSVTHFLGYVHALSRKLKQSHNLSLGGCAITCHQHQIHAYQPKGFGEYIFALTRNPIQTNKQAASLNSKDKKPPPIIQEGKMHLTISLVIECEGLIKGGDAGVKALQEHLMGLCLTQKLAGGVINQIKNIFIESANTDEDKKKLTQRIRRRLLPGFVLLDRSQYLEKHFTSLQENNPKAELLDAWLDFSTLKFKSEALLEKDEEINEKTKGQWSYLSKPESGYLVPITTGYRAVTDVYDAGKIAGSRDTKVPICFVESAYGIGEWQSPHRLKDIESALWHYHHEEGWYLCANKTNIDNYVEIDEEDNLDFINY